MTQKKLNEILEAHKLWLNGEGGRRADLSGADLSSADLSSADLSSADLRYADLSGADLRYADLSSANLSSANLSSADLSSANLRYADLSSADLRYADLRYADLSIANLRYADLSGANLSGANLSSADLSSADLSSANGLLSSVNFMEAHFERTEEGYIVYKCFGGMYVAPENWKLGPGSIISENVNPNRTNDCGCGINVAPLNWVKKNFDKQIWKLLIKWEWLPGVVVPYNTDGKIRCERAMILGMVDGDGNLMEEE